MVGVTYNSVSPTGYTLEISVIEGEFVVVTQTHPNGDSFDAFSEDCPQLGRHCSVDDDLGRLALYVFPPDGFMFGVTYNAFFPPGFSMLYATTQTGPGGPSAIVGGSCFPN